MDLDRKQAIGLMLASFPASQSQGQLVALAYLMAVDGFSDYAVIKSAQEFIRGEVKDHDKRFAPSAAQFADHVAKSEIPEQVVDYASRHPQALASPQFDPRYKAEMQRRITEAAAKMRIGGGPSHKIGIGDREGDRDVA